MKPKHTPEPWRFYKNGHGTHINIVSVDCDIYGRRKHDISQLHIGSNKNSETNGQRIVDCVNACEGINPEAVPEILQVLKANIDDICGCDDSSDHGPIQCDFCKVISRAEGGNQ